MAEFQCRGLIHFHAIFRLNGTDPTHPERAARRDWHRRQQPNYDLLRDKTIVTDTELE